MEVTQFQDWAKLYWNSNNNILVWGALKWKEIIIIIMKIANWNLPISTAIYVSRRGILICFKCKHEAIWTNCVESINWGCYFLDEGHLQKCTRNRTMEKLWVIWLHCDFAKSCKMPVGFFSFCHYKIFKADTKKPEHQLISMNKSINQSEMVPAAGHSS